MVLGIGAHKRMHTVVPVDELGRQLGARVTQATPTAAHLNVISHDALIASAEAVLNPHTVDGRWLGDVASTLVTEAGAVFSGVCIDTGSGTGFCAEHAAIAAMVTAGQYKIMKIVAVWRDDDGVLHVVAPGSRD